MTKDEEQKLADEKVYNLIADKVRVEAEANRINQQTLTSLRLQNRLNNDIIQRYAHLAEQVETWIASAESQGAANEVLSTNLKHAHETAKDLLKEIRAFSSVLHEVMDELSRRQDRFENQISQRLGRLEDLELMQLSGQRLSKDQATQAIIELQRERKQREIQDRKSVV